MDEQQTLTAGKGMLSLWVTRRQLHLSRSTMRSEDKGALLKLPVIPTAMFGPGVTTLLQWAQEARQCVKEVSCALTPKTRTRWSGKSRGQRVEGPTLAPGWSPDDPRATLYAHRGSAGATRGAAKGSSGSGKPRWPPSSS